MSRVKLPPYQRKKSSNSSLFILPQAPSSIKMSSQNGAPTPELPSGTICLENQVAGHTFAEGSDNIGMLKNLDDGSVMKPMSKPLCGIREINFYDLVSGSTHPDVVPLKELIPEYRGTQKLKILGKEIDFLRLTDLTQNMLEPCIMDVKIGKRTWDPLASTSKREAEDSKYKPCKENLGLCIPGFQVYSISSGIVKRYGKDYGKKLNPETIKDAFRVFLNAEIGLDRQLITKFLSVLWNVQAWARTQTKFRLYSSSLLFIYDARRLRHNSKCKNASPPSDQLNDTSKGTPPTLSPPLLNVVTATQDTEIEPTHHYYQIQRNHSSTNNYDKDYKEMRQQYELMLDSMLLDSVHKKEWATIKMIDFAHAFVNNEVETDAADEVKLDDNYLFGVENLVKMFEEFLKECE